MDTVACGPIYSMLMVTFAHIVVCVDWRKLDCVGVLPSGVKIKKITAENCSLEN